METSLQTLTGCFITRAHEIDIVTSEDESHPPPPPAHMSHCARSNAAWRGDHLSSACACYTTEDGVGTYDDFVSARVSPYTGGDAPVELGDNHDEVRAPTTMIDAEVVQACRKGDVAELEQLGLTMDLEAVDVLGYSAVSDARVRVKAW